MHADLREWFLAVAHGQIICPWARSIRAHPRLQAVEIRARDRLVRTRI